MRNNFGFSRPFHYICILFTRRQGRRQTAGQAHTRMKIQLYKDQYGKTLKLAAPIMTAQLGMIVVQLVDNAMVGRLGALPLAAVSFGGTVFFLLFIFCLGITMALTPLVGERFARGRYRSAAAYFQNSLVLFTVIGILGVAVSLGVIPLLYRLGQPVEVVDMAIPYFKYLAWSILPIMIFGSFRQFLEGIGNTSINMVVIITSNLVNIFFNWLLIYGNWDFPAMGAAGAGLATLISRIIAPIMSLAWLMALPRFRRYFRYFRRENFSRRRMAAILKVGLPISSQMFMEGSAFALTSIMMGWFGTIAIAGNQIATVISNFAFMIVVGISSATTIRVSHEYGRGNLKSLRRAGNASYHLTFIWNTFTALSFILFREHIARIFTDDPEAIRIAGNLLIFVAAFQFSDGLQSVSVGILRGIQDVKVIMRIAFVSYLVINLPIGYFCAFVLKAGPGGLWVGLILGLSIAAVLLATRFRKQYARLRQQQIRRQHPGEAA